MSRSTFRSLIAAIGLLAGLNCGQAFAAEPGTDFISIGTAGPAGVYFVAGNAICQLLNKDAAEGRLEGRHHGIRCAAPSTAGSIYNLDRLRERKLDFAIVQSDWQYHAANGTDRFEGNAFDDLRILFSLHAEPFQILAGAGTDIASWADLQGKRVNIGNPESGQRETFRVLMDSYGVGEDYFGEATSLTSSEQARALCDGRIDAFGFIVGVPNASVAEAADGCDATIIPLDGLEVELLVEENPFYAFTTIPAGTYATIARDVKTFGVTATLVTRADVPEHLAYEVTRSVFENFDEFRRFHPAFRNLKPSDMISRGVAARFHPGALRYFTEKGFF